MAVLQLLSDDPEVRQVYGDIIPGPPPSYASSLVVNVEPTWKVANISAGDILARSRRLCFKVLLSLEPKMLTQASIVGVSIVDSPEYDPVRVYSLSVGANAIADIRNEDDLVRFALNEFSMLEEVEKLIR